jgi:hypothetical protein
VRIGAPVPRRRKPDSLPPGCCRNSRWPLGSSEVTPGSSLQVTKERASAHSVDPMVDRSFLAGGAILITNELPQATLSRL